MTKKPIKSSKVSVRTREKPVVVPRLPKKPPVTQENKEASVKRNTIRLYEAEHTTLHALKTQTGRSLSTILKFLINLHTPAEIAQMLKDQKPADVTKGRKRQDLSKARPGVKNNPSRKKNLLRRT